MVFTNKRGRTLTTHFRICPYKNAKLWVIVMDEFGYTWDLMKCPLL